MAEGTAPRPVSNDIQSDEVTGNGITIEFKKWNRVVVARLISGTITSDLPANSLIASCPVGFTSAINYEFRDIFSNKRLMINKTGLYNVNEALSSGTVLRGTITYISES